MEVQLGNGECWRGKRGVKAAAPLAFFGGEVGKCRGWLKERGGVPSYCVFITVLRSKVVMLSLEDALCPPQASITGGASRTRKEPPVSHGILSLTVLYSAEVFYKN